MSKPELERVGVLWLSGKHEQKKEGTCRKVGVLWVGGEDLKGLSRNARRECTKASIAKRNGGRAARRERRRGGRGDRWGERKNWVNFRFEGGIANCNAASGEELEIRETAAKGAPMDARALLHYSEAGMLNNPYENLGHGGET